MLRWEGKREKGRVSNDRDERTSSPIALTEPAKQNRASDALPALILRTTLPILVSYSFPNPIPLPAYLRSRTVAFPSTSLFSLSRSIP